MYLNISEESRYDCTAWTFLTAWIEGTWLQGKLVHLKRVKRKDSLFKIPQQHHR